ncbi:hypothetical protein ACHAW6_001871 [Cyclotella cf. meneghiniana]
MLTAKILINSVISTIGARFMTMDTSNFYLNTPLARPEYICMSIHDIPEEIIIEYKSVTSLHLATASTSRSCLAFMDSHTPDSLPMNSSKNDSTNMGITKVSLSPGFGNTIGIPSGSPQW